MQTAWFTLLGFVLALGLVATVEAQGDKEAKVAGSVTCAKCDLNQEKKCTTVVVEKSGDKSIIYYFDAESHKTHHAGVCKAAKKGTVFGKVSEKDNKKIIAVTKIDFDK